MVVPVPIIWWVSGVMTAFVECEWRVRTCVDKHVEPAWSHGEYGEVLVVETFEAELR